MSKRRGFSDSFSACFLFVITICSFAFFILRFQILNSSFFAFIFPVSVIYEHPTLATRTKTAIPISEIPRVQSDSQLHTHPIAEQSSPLNESIHIEYKMAIMCLSMGISSRTASNHQSYADMWGYDYIEFKSKIDSRKPERQKFIATLKVFERPESYTHVFWIDADAFFTNCSESLSKFVYQMHAERTSWLFSGDNFVINSAQILWKNDEIAKNILQKMDSWLHKLREMKQGYWRDNEVLLAYLGGANEPVMTQLEVGLGITSTCQRQGDQEQCNWNREGTKKYGLHMVPKDRKEHLSYVPYGEINNYYVDKNNLIFHCAGIKHGGPVLRTTSRCISYFNREKYPPKWPQLLTCSEIHSGDSSVKTKLPQVTTAPKKSIPLNGADCSIQEDVDYRAGTFRSACDDGKFVSSYIHCQALCTHCEQCAAWVAQPLGNRFKCWISSGDEQGNVDFVQSDQKRYAALRCTSGSVNTNPPTERKLPDLPPDCSVIQNDFRCLQKGCNWRDGRCRDNDAMRNYIEKRNKYVEKRKTNAIPNVNCRRVAGQGVTCD